MKQRAEERPDTPAETTPDARPGGAPKLNTNALEHGAHSDAKKDRKRGRDWSEKANKKQAEKARMRRLYRQRGRKAGRTFLASLSPERQKDAIVRDACKKLGGLEAIRLLYEDALFAAPTKVARDRYADKVRETTAQMLNLHRTLFAAEDRVSKSDDAKGALFEFMAGVHAGVFEPPVAAETKPEDQPPAPSSDDADDDLRTFFDGPRPQPTGGKPLTPLQLAWRRGDAFDDE